MAFPHYFYGDPADVIDRMRADEKAEQEWQEKRRRLNEEDLKFVPKEWMKGKHDRSRT